MSEFKKYIQVAAFSSVVSFSAGFVVGFTFCSYETDQSKMVHSNLYQKVMETKPTVTMKDLNGDGSIDLCLLDYNGKVYCSLDIDSNCTQDVYMVSKDGQPGALFGKEQCTPSPDKETILDLLER